MTEQPLFPRVRDKIEKTKERIRPQGLPPRGTGLKRGTARTGLERGRGLRLTEEERRERHERIFGQRFGGGKVIERTKARVKKRVEKVKRRKPGVIPRASETFERWVPGKKIKEFLEPIRGELYTAYERKEKIRTLPPKMSRAF